MPPIIAAVRALRSRLLLVPVLLAACDVHDATLLRQPEPSARLPASAVDAGPPAMDAGDGVDADGCFPNPDPSGASPCPRVCPERCNGLDDDCDDATDEDASATCDADNAVAQCVDGACLIAECEPEFRDCDSRAETGCEVSIVDDPAHCGGCGLACAADRAQELLCRDDSSCAIATCSDGFGDCDLELDNGCETLVRTLEDCGGCASRGEAAPCSDLPNATASDCDTGRCRIMECASGFIDCDGIADNGCEEADGPGACGCDETDPTDSDDDGEPDCTDRCDDDPDKTEEGACGCGSADTDSDQDGSADCIDLCDDDPAKQEPGGCGCGVPEGDRDGDGTPDCDDGCPGDDRTTDACFGGWHSNFDDRVLDFDAGGSGVLDCGETRIDTTAPDGEAIVTFDNWCGPLPAVSVSAQQGGGPELVVIALRELRVASGATLLVVGDRPLAFAVRGDVDIDGTVDASASGSTAGAGGDLGCGNAAGGDGAGSPGRWGQDPQAGASGGGGGGFASAGGPGGTADTDRNGSATTNQGTPGGGGGATRGNASLVPLVGGCPGGRAGGCSAAPGAGGGALQISASGTLRVTGSLRARGGDGSTPCGGSDEGGGTGGGSGGALLLEAGSLDLGGPSIDLGGGRGGSNGSYAGIYNCGASGGGAGSGNASSPGQPGVSCQGGSSGGGGGHGRLQTREGAN